MNDINNTTQKPNPLLQIDTVFRTYLNAYTRSYQNHMVNGNLDYAFDADFAVRQKIMGLSGWSRLFKTINTQDAATEARHLFVKCNQAGPLKYPDIFDTVKKCSERLELSQPVVFIRDDIERPVIYSLESEKIDPCIVISKSLVDMCNQDELALLIGEECGRIQNNHPAFCWACTYLNFNKDAFKNLEQSYQQPFSSQLFAALAQWIQYADITAGRAAMICLDAPGRYMDILSVLYAKGYVDFFGRTQSDLDFKTLSDVSNQLRVMDLRTLSLGGVYTPLDRALLAVNEFLYCQTLYKWRTDIPKQEDYNNSAEVCDVRTNILLGNGGSFDE